jgi:hypothetical protein
VSRSRHAAVAVYTLRIAVTMSSVSRFVNFGSISTPAKRFRMSIVRGHDAAPYSIARPRALVNDGHAGWTVTFFSI